MAKEVIQLDKGQKERILRQKITNVEVQKYEMELALKVSEAISDPPQVTENIKANIAKQKKALDVLDVEWQALGE